MTPLTGLLVSIWFLTAFIFLYGVFHGPDPRDQDQDR